MRRISLGVILAIFFTLIAAPSMANSIDSVDITVDLHDDGSATVTDRRTYTATEGTEHFLRFGNLGSSVVTVISVEQDGQMLTDAGWWDSDRSIEDKAGTYSDMYKEDYQEIIFGIGSLGTHEAVITYKVTNIVRNLNDGKQAIYWQFTNPESDPISSLTITVNDTVISTDDTRAWGFGFEGDTTIDPGSVTLRSTAGLDKDNYSVLLMIVPGDSFPYARSSFDEDSASMEARAKEGSDWVSNETWIDVVMYLVIGIGVTFLVWIIALPFRFAAHKLRNRRPDRTGFIDSTRDYVRDLPAEPFTTLTHVGGADPQHVIAAILLTWVGDGTLEAGENEDGPFLQINGRPRTRFGEVSDELSTVLAGASSGTIITEKSMKKYVRRNPERFTKLLRAIDKTGRHEAFKAGYLTYLTKKRAWGRTRIEATPEGTQKSAELAGLKAFLEDFSLIDQRTVPEVHLWTGYLAWAAFFGIADKVATQFAAMNPAVAAPLIIATQTSTSMANVMPDSYRSSNFNPFSGSGGMGGSTSVGGGGGAAGASTGGGTR